MHELKIDIEELAFIIDCIKDAESPNNLLDRTKALLAYAEAKEASVRLWEKYNEMCCPDFMEELE